MLLVFLSSLYADLQMFVTYLSVDRVSVKVTTRFLAEETHHTLCVMSELPIEIDERAYGGRGLL